MGIEDYAGFGSTEVNQEVQRSERAEALLENALREHPNSTLVQKLEGLSEEDIIVLDQACNMLNTDFASLGVYEAYEEDEDVRVLMDMLEDLSNAAPQEKERIARALAKKIAD